jgi:hypothetical protein
MPEYIPDFTDSVDGVIKVDTHHVQHTGQFVMRTTQPTEDLIYERNAELQKDRALTSGNNLLGMQYVGEIPMILLNKWMREDPEMKAKDPAIRNAALYRHIKATPECMVVDPKTISKVGQR